MKKEQKTRVKDIDQLKAFVKQGAKGSFSEFIKSSGKKTQAKKSK